MSKNTFHAENVQDADYDYNPSQFIKDCPGEAAVSIYMQQNEQESNNVRKHCNVELDVPYGQQKKCVIDFYSHKDTPKNAPVFIFIHGGFWQMEDANKNNHGFIAYPVLKAKSITAVLEYELAPEVSLDEMVVQIQCAVEFIKKRYPNSKLFIGGHSAGAHLAAMMLTRTWQDPNLQISGAVLLSGLYYLQPLIQTSYNEPLKMDIAAAERNSPTVLIKDKKPSFDCPVVVAYGEFDPPKLHKMSIDFAKALEKHGIPVKCVEIPTQDHFSLLTKFKDPEFVLSKEIVKMLTE